MRELTQVRDAVISALERAGMTTLVAFPAQSVKNYSGAVATVSVSTAESKTMGFCNYLGEEYDEAAGTMRELYGKQLEGDITVEVRAEKAADCENGCAVVADVLLSGLPFGIHSGELRWEELKWEKTTDMFLRRGSLRCQAVFTARTGEDGETFLDFTLRGVMKH